MFGGWWGDWMIRRGISVNFARKAPMVMGLLLTGTIVLANFIESNTLVVLVLSSRFFAQGMSSTNWVVISEIAPKQLVGMTGSIISFASNLAGIITPITIRDHRAEDGLVRLGTWLLRDRLPDLACLPTP